MLNLLPSEIKQKYQATSKAYGISGFYVLILVIIGLAATALGTYNYTRQLEINQKQSQLDALNSTQLKNETLASQAAFIQDRLAASASYQDATHWEDVVNAVAADTPTTVQLTDIKLTTTPTTSLAISGHAGDARSPILFEQKLNQDKNFSGAQLTSLTQSDSNKTVVYTFVLNVGVQHVAR